MKLPRKLLTVVCGASMMLGLATPGLANYDAPMTWVENVSGTTNDLNDVWGTSASNVWAVGDSGTILYYNGNSWTAQQTSVTADLKSIWGRSASDIYAVGTGGTYLHYNGTQWSEVTTGFQTTNNIWDVAGTADTNFFAMIYSGTGSEETTFEVARQSSSLSDFAGIDICGGSGTACTPDRSNERYNGIWMMEDGEVFMSGFDLSSGDGFVRRSDKDLRGTATANTSWPQVQLAAPGQEWAIGIPDLWGAGNSVYFIAAGPGSRSAAYKYDRVTDAIADKWDLSPSPPADVWGLNENSVYFLTSDSIFHYDATELNEEEVQADKTFSLIDSFLNNIPVNKRSFNGIWAADESNIFVVGNGGVILQFDGIEAQPQLNSPADSSNQPGTSVAFDWSGVPYSTDDFTLTLYDDDTLEHISYGPFPINDYNYLDVSLSGLPDDGRTYYWRIETDNGYYLADYLNGRSEARSFTNGTSLSSHLRSPRNAEIVPSTNGSITFEWFPFEDKVWYYLQIADNSSNILWGDWVNNTQKSLGGFTDNNTEYFWRVLPNNGQYWSYWRSFTNK